MQGWGIFDAGKHDYSLVTGIKSWKANAVRVPLNEDCWLGINGIKPEYSGANYQNAIAEYVKMFTDSGLVVVLDLHWTAPGSQQAKAQTPMPDIDHSVDFWRSVARKFGQEDKIILELFNEPYPDKGNWNSVQGWKCWRDGESSCSGLGYQGAGMQSLVSAVRSAGAKNVLLLGGLAWSNSLAQWMQYLPSDPLNTRLQLGIATTSTIAAIKTAGIHLWLK